MSSYRRKTGGYTIIEVVIVLTVSALLFSTSIVVFNQQNRKTQFTDSVNNFAQDIQDVLNDVETGFYPTTNNFACTSDSTNGGYPYAPASAPAARQGTNTNCIFVGKAIQFAPGPASSTNRANIDIYTLVGRRIKLSTTDPVTSIDDAKPAVLNNMEVGRKTLTAGVEIVSVRPVSSPATALSGFAMVSNSNGVSTGVNSRASLATIAGSLDNSSATFKSVLRVGAINSAKITEASGGINICLKESGSNGRYAVIQLAAGESQIIVNTKIDQSCS